MAYSEKFSSVEYAADDTGGGFDAPVVHIDNFNGPLDLLWELIKKSRIDITEVSISEITDQYIAYLKLMEKLNIRIASEFIWMASELLYYKSKAVLPAPDVEDDFIKKKTPDLIQKLLEYKRFQSVSHTFQDIYDVHADVYTRQNVYANTDEWNEEYIEASLFDLIKAFAVVMDAPASVEQREIVFDEVLVSDRMDYILSLLRDKEYLIFTDMFSRIPAKAEVVASFLAVLEMTKAEMIRVLQHRAFGDIRLVHRFPADA